MSSICVEGCKFKIFTKNPNGTITLTDQFKSLWFHLYNFPEFRTNSPNAGVLVDDFLLPGQSQSELSGRSTDSGFLLFTDVTKPLMPTPGLTFPVTAIGINIDLNFSNLIYIFRWQITPLISLDNCQAGKVEIRFLSYITDSDFDINSTFPMVSTKNNLTIFRGLEGSFKLPHGFTDEVYVHVNILCTMKLSVSVQVPKPFRIPPRIGRRPVPFLLPIKGCGNEYEIVIYTQREIDGTPPRIEERVEPEFRKTFREIHDTLVFYSLPYPLTPIIPPIIPNQETITFRYETPSGSFMIVPDQTYRYVIISADTVDVNQNPPVPPILSQDLIWREALSDGSNLVCGMELPIKNDGSQIVQVSLVYDYNVRDPRATIQTLSYFQGSGYGLGVYYDGSTQPVITGNSQRYDFILPPTANQFGFSFFSILPEEVLARSIRVTYTPR